MMRVSDVLATQRVWVSGPGAADIWDRAGALDRLSALLAPAAEVERAVIAEHLERRERLQTTGIGEGVAIPHCALSSVPRHLAALLLIPEGIDFQAIDRQPVRIVFGVVGPCDTRIHLRLLTRISRILRNPATRSALCAADNALEAMQVIREAEGAG